MPLLERAPADYWRPSVRGDCASFGRPCPFVACRHHLFLDVKANGNIRLNFPLLAPSDLADSCSLDLADEGGLSLLRVGDALGITREMVRQMEEKILGKMPRDGAGLGYVPEPPPGLPLGRVGRRS